MGSAHRGWHQILNHTILKVHVMQFKFEILFLCPTMAVDVVVYPEKSNSPRLNPVSFQSQSLNFL